MIDSWALAAFLIYFVGYAGQVSTIMRDPVDGPQSGAWAFLYGLFWPLAALAEVLRKEDYDDDA